MDSTKAILLNERETKQTLLYFRSNNSTISDQTYELS
jgi:hypothetical protein